MSLRNYNYRHCEIFSFVIGSAAKQACPVGRQSPALNYVIAKEVRLKQSLAMIKPVRLPHCVRNDDMHRGVVDFLAFLPLFTNIYYPETFLFNSHLK